MARKTKGEILQAAVSNPKGVNEPARKSDTEIREQNRFLYEELLSRRLDQFDKEELFYHYCSPETFVSIMTNRMLRYSDLSLLNDAEERVWGYKKVFQECLERLKIGRGVKIGIETISSAGIDRLEQIWAYAEAICQPFVCCFSTDGDSLSQWRAYASDGAGLCIGFRRSNLLPIPASLMKVEYNLETQIDEMFDAISTIAKTIDLESETVDWRESLNAGIPLSARSIAFKNPAFRDENEVRSSYLVMVDDSDGQRKYSAVGGKALGQKVVGPDIKFQARNSVIVPYVDFPFDGEQHPANVCAVHLGPKCKNSSDEIKLFLKTLGYDNVEVAVAGAAYR